MNQTPIILQREKEIEAFHNRPAISYSRLHAYDTCPEQYRLRYIEGYRPKQEKAYLVFGSVLHFALAEHFRSEQDPVAKFTGEWDRLKYHPLLYETKESWWDFRQKGKALLEKFMTEERQKISNVRAVEKRFELNIANIPLPIIGMIDLIADVEGEFTIMDFKTSGVHFHPWEAQLSDQLLTYFLAEPQAHQMAFCIFLKTKEPEIEWRFSRREFTDLGEYLTKISWVLQDIDQARFYKRPGRHCKWCDYRPLCLKDTRRAADTLVQIQSDTREGGDTK